MKETINEPGTEEQSSKKMELDRLQRLRKAQQTSQIRRWTAAHKGKQNNAGLNTAGDVAHCSSLRKSASPPGITRREGKALAQNTVSWKP